MEDQGQDEPNSRNHVSSYRSEPVRSRWTPKPEQILLLESIFNSGMVNPPKDETVRIRKLLEKFGAVGDANVFYWFQNRRSRSRRRQRLIQASLDQQRNQAQIDSSALPQYDQSHNIAANTDFGVSDPSFDSSSSSYHSGSNSSSCGISGDDGVGGTLFPVSGPIGFSRIEQSSAVTPLLCTSDTSNLHFQYGFIVVFINGVPTEVPKGPLDVKAMFGKDAMLVHSYGVPVLTNEFGFLMQSLQHGESYFLVSKPT